MASRASDVRVRWVLIAVGGLFVVTAAIALSVVAVQGTRNADASADEILDRIAVRTADLIDGQLQPLSVSLTQMATTLDEAVTPTADAREHILVSQLDSMPAVSGAFVAKPDGSFEFARREGDEIYVKRIVVENGQRQVLEGRVGADRSVPAPLAPIEDNGFHPSDRPWYAEAIENPGETVWTAPYVFFTSGEPGVSAAIGIADENGKTVSVVGIDVTLTSLGSSVQDLPIDAAADAYVMADGLVIAGPADQSVVTPDGDGGVELISADVLGLVETDDSLVATAQIEREGHPEWQIAVRADHIGFVDAVRQQTRLAIAAVGVAVLVGLLLLGVIAFRLRRPLDELTTRIDRDPLTDLPNRRAILEFGAAAMRTAETRRSDVTVAVIDIDHFKNINDRFGHAAGDAALRRLGDGLRDNVRSTDLVGRYGGDEFVVILVNTGLKRGREAMTQIASAAEAELQSEPEAASCTVSYGIASGEGRPLDIDELIAEADEILLAVKRSRPEPTQTGQPPR